MDDPFLDCFLYCLPESKYRSQRLGSAKGKWSSVQDAECVSSCRSPHGTHGRHVPKMSSSNSIWNDLDVAGVCFFAFSCAAMEFMSVHSSTIGCESFRKRTRRQNLHGFSSRTRYRSTLLRICLLCLSITNMTLCVKWSAWGGLERVRSRAGRRARCVRVCA